MVSCYADIVQSRPEFAHRTGRDVGRNEHDKAAPVKVTEGSFTYVALADDGAKRSVPEVEAGGAGNP